jgi:hypothetical protein
MNYLSYIRVIDMGPEEFHYMDRFSNQYFKNMREVRISSLYWVWDNLSSNSGSIRRETIIELIPYQSLEKLLSELEEEERYEDCVVVRDIMNLYEEHERKGLYKELF